MFEYIDKYCERTSPELWGEPFNIVSNLAYFIAAILILRLYQQQDVKAWDVQTLILLMMAIACGSSLWHITAKNWALYTDAIPILIFINLYFICYLYRAIKLSYLMIGVIFLFYHLVNYNVQLYFDKDTLNGSLFYLPTGLFLLGMSLMLFYKNRTLSYQMFFACFIFCAAIIFRTLDLQLCHTLFMGTHFIWHILSAYMMYLLLKLLIPLSIHRKVLE